MSTLAEYLGILLVFGAPPAGHSSPPKDLVHGYNYKAACEEQYRYSSSVRYILNKWFNGARDI